MIAKNRLQLAAVALLAVSAISGCVDIGGESRVDVSPTKAIQILADESYLTPLPTSFAPIKAIESHIAQGSANVAIEIAFSATQSDLDRFLTKHHAEKGPPYFQPSGCAAPTGRQGTTAPLPDAFTSTWFVSVFPKCSVLEYAKLPDTEWRGQRTSGGIYRQLNSGVVASGQTVNLVLTFVKA